MTEATLKSAGTGRESNTSPFRLRTKVYDQLAEARGIGGPTAQANLHGLERAHWHRIRAGKIQPRVGLALQIAQQVGSTVEALWEQAA